MIGVLRIGGEDYIMSDAGRWSGPDPYWVAALDAAGGPPAPGQSRGRAEFRRAARLLAGAAAVVKPPAPPPPVPHGEGVRL